MTKKHFIALADHIRFLNDGMGDDPVYLDRAISTLANWLGTQNERFNRERWLAYVRGECGPNGGTMKKAKVTA